MAIAFLQRVSFRVLAALLIIIVFFLVSNGGALVAILRFQERFAEIAGNKLPGLIAASNFAKSSERIAANAPNLAVATSQMMRETVVDQIQDQVSLLNSSLEQVKSAGATLDRYSSLQDAKENMVGLLKTLDEQVRRQIDLDAKFIILLDQLRNDASRIDNDPILVVGVPGIDSGERSSGHVDAARWTAPANEAVAVMLAGVGTGDEFRLERLRTSFLQLWQRMEAALPASPSMALLDLRDEIRHLGVEPGSIFDLRIAQIRGRTAIQGALRANKRASSRLVSSAAEMFQMFDEEIQRENAFLRQLMYYYQIFFVAIGLFCTAVGAWLFIYIDRGVIRRLQSLQECMRARVDSQPVAIPMSGRDEIAEMARATEHFVTTIERREESLNRIFEAAPMPITLVRMVDGGIVRANGRAIREFGLTLAPDCSATNVYRGALERSAFLERLAHRGFVDGHEARLVNASSKTIYALLAGQLIESDGELCGLVGVTDISLLKEAEEAQRVAKERAEEAAIAKSRFLTNVSHELRTPLNAIIGLTEILYDGAAHFGTERAMEPLSRVIKAGRHLLQLINQILDIAKVEAGKMDLIIEEVTIASLVDEVVSTVALLAEQNGNRISVNQDPDLTTLFTDRMRLRQILLNLLSNASRFTVRGEILIAVEKEAVDGSDWIAFRVADTGVGISEEHIGRLFEEFGQADPSTSRQYGGTGLGLAISDRLSRLMRGSIIVKSKLGVGSTFVVRLPMSTESRPRLGSNRGMELTSGDESLSRSSSVNP
jgi:adenylate cyclase